MAMVTTIDNGGDDRISDHPGDSGGFKSRLRVESCWNTTSETIPPFAAMLLKRTESRQYSQRKYNGAYCWEVMKCDEDAQNRQDASEFVFNTELPIDPNTPGECTFDFPCLALLPKFSEFGESESTAPLRCGPVEDSWLLSIEGVAFAILSYEIYDQFNTDIPIGWIAKGESRQVEMVQLWTGGGTVGDLHEANEDGYFLGRRIGWSNGGIQVQEDVFIKLVDYQDDADEDHIGEHGRYHFGRLVSGAVTSDDETLPLYLCEMGDQEYLAISDDTVEKGATGTFNLLHRSDESESGFTKEAKAKGHEIIGGDISIVARLRGKGWYASMYEQEEEE